MGKDSIDETGVLSFWVLSSLKVADSQGEVTLDDRLVSVTFLSHIWQKKAEFISKSIQGVGEAILNILKRGARDLRQTLTIVSIELMFRLLESFAAERG